jgi:hypothetical protein
MEKSESAGSPKDTYPLIITLISFALFVAVYVFLVTKSVNPRYFGNLVFAVPFVAFGLIAFSTRAGRIKPEGSAVLTLVLMIILGIVMLCLFCFRVLQESTTVTTDVTRYERVLRITGYPQNPLTKYYPASIPDSADNVMFSFMPAIGQGGQNTDLKFSADRYSIESYDTAFSQLAQWEGKAGSPEAEQNGIFLGTLAVFGYPELPSDFTVYVLEANPYQPGNWNHGSLSLVAISPKRLEIIFHAESW